MFAFPSGVARNIEHMFSNDNTQERFRFAKFADVAVEFATLGEYRVVAIPPDSIECTSADRMSADPAYPDLWAGDVDWMPTPRRREAGGAGEITCRLPRAHDRGARLVLSA